MKALFHSEPILSPIPSLKIKPGVPTPKTSLQFPLAPAKRYCSVKAVLDSTHVDELSEIRNPAVSTSYRNPKSRRPNQTVLDAQTKVCTGPTQTKPLNAEQAFKVLDTILKSVKGELKDEDEVSNAQLGAFFAAMTIRANAFPEPTQWSDGERTALTYYWPHLVRVLPPAIVFLADPEQSIMGVSSSIGPRFVGSGTAEMRLVGALREILAGGHLGYEEVQGVLRDVLPLGSEDKKTSAVSEALLAAFLIGQRMNRETDRELKAYCLAFDDELGPAPVADVRSLTHYGEPYDGNTRYFRSTLFVAAVRSCYGESCLLHGVDWMPPKGGITEEQMLKFMGANTHLTPMQAKALLEDEDIGFAYISQREAQPSLYSLIGLREHIKKRPPLATTEKVQQIVRAKGKEAIVAGFYHGGYEESLLMLMRRRGVHSGLVVKGEEGALSMTTRLRSPNASKGLPVNYCSGFRSLNETSNSAMDGVSRENFNTVVNAKDYGFEQTDTPRTDRSVTRNIELGLAALRGEKGAAYDRIVLNAGMVDHLLGCEGAEDISSALERAREAIDSGRALEKLLGYINKSNRVV
ncbi:anthranilate phosphoribosyltransferase [Perilla frutescens var. hirtella]|uniref:Anthranilate phosphoribosyltransferase n=1 Tax=Perilla frutescens var. hirtella TaxID=608512 RepID=A0AAD4J220_PERFH|nr:anthranilate phosphoribosyltransferase [Perilla frutescens var. hirtella]